MSTENKVTPVPAARLTSEKLTDLKAKQVANMEALTKENDFDVKLKLMQEGFKISQDIAAEEAAIKKANVAAAIKEAQDKKMKLVDDFAAAVLANAAVQNDKKSSDEAKAESATALDASRKELQNLILGTVKQPTAEKAASAGTGTKGAKGAEIIALHEANLAAGMTPTESKKAIVEAGHSRGTTGAVVLAWEKEQGVK